MPALCRVAANATVRLLVEKVREISGAIDKTGQFLSRAANLVHSGLT